MKLEKVLSTVVVPDPQVLKRAVVKAMHKPEYMTGNVLQQEQHILFGTGIDKFLVEVGPGELAFVRKVLVQHLANKNNEVVQKFLSEVIDNVFEVLKARSAEPATSRVVEHMGGALITTHRKK